MLKTVTNSINASQIQTPITLPGDVTLSTGNLVMGTSGKGIDFSATSHPAGMTSELLADYEEGTWTPNQGSNLSVVGVFSSSGRYTKIGNQVTVCFTLNGTTSVSATAGGEIISNLPFSVGSGGSGIGGVYQYGAFGSTCIASQGSTSVYSSVAIPAATAINFSITYLV